MSIPSKFKTKAEAIVNSWFSRRHETNAEHLANRERLKVKGKKIKEK